MKVQIFLRVLKTLTSEIPDPVRNNAGAWARPAQLTDMGHCPLTVQRMLGTARLSKYAFAPTAQATLTVNRQVAGAYNRP